MSKKVYTGINIQWPISEDITSGEKVIETRTYPIPEKYIGEDVLLIETPGKKGKFKARITAIVRFTECFEYKNKKQFYADVDKHLVDKNSDWAWKDKGKWGWKVKVIKVFKKPLDAPKKKGIKYTSNISL